MSFRSKLVGLMVGITLFGSSGDAYARKNLNVQYKVHESHVLKSKEVALEVLIKRNVSYSILAKIYTGDERNAIQIKAFNDSKNLIFIKDKPMKIYIPQELLSASLKKIFDENKFVTYEIASAEEEGDEVVNNLWEIASSFMSDNLNMNDKINILLAINDDINPTNGIVYAGQKIIVPESLVNMNTVQGVAPTKKAPIVPVKPEPVKPQVVVIEKGKQNPYRVSIKSILDNLSKKDKYGSGRLRTLGKGKFKASKHKGIDLAAPIGTSLYPVEAGTVISAGKTKGALWRNGIVVEYKTKSGVTLKYCHLKSVAKGIKIGVPVGLNTVLGYVGASGNASKNYPHVHIGAKVGGKVVNPAKYVLVDSVRK